MGTRRWCLSAVTALVAVLAVSGCTSSGTGDSSGATTGGASSTRNGDGTSSASPTSAPAVLTFSPADNAQNVNPTSLVTVAVAGGTLTDVTVANAAGAKVPGAISADKTGWQAKEILGYAKTYTVAAATVNVEGVAAKTVSTFTTVQPDNLTMPYFDTTGGGAMTAGATYGVGMVVNVHFDEQIPDKKAAEKALSVKTTPAVAGSWYWLSDQNVHWRPQKYFKPGTKVTVTAKVYGVNVGNRLYGQADKSVSFTIGTSHVSIADDNTKLVQVYENGKLIRSMPTSMGKGGRSVIKGKTITYWTQPGIMTVLDQANPVLMDSETYGLPHAAGGYKELVYWSTRITTDGVYLHSAPWSVWAQGNTDTSHGCLNLSPENAQWFYEWSVVGDVVQVKNTGGSQLEVWQNGDWSVPWAEWLKGSALR